MNGGTNLNNTYFGSKSGKWAKKRSTSDHTSFGERNRDEQFLWHCRIELKNEEKTQGMSVCWPYSQNERFLHLDSSFCTIPFLSSRILMLYQRICTSEVMDSSTCFKRTGAVIFYFLSYGEELVSGNGQLEVCGVVFVSLRLWRVPRGIISVTRRAVSFFVLFVLSIRFPPSIPFIVSFFDVLLMLWDISYGTKRLKRVQCIIS